MNKEDVYDLLDFLALYPSLRAELRNLLNLED